MIILEKKVLLFYGEACLYSNYYSIVLVIQMVEVYAIVAFMIGMFGTYTVLDIIGKRRVKGSKVVTVRSK